MGIPIDWYRTSLFSNLDSLFFEEGAEERVRLAVEVLQLEAHERVLDLACATGRRVHELSRMGYDVVGVDPSGCLLETAAGEAELETLKAIFIEGDPRYLEFSAEFDVVLSLGGGALEHFDYDEENLRAFRAAAEALRPGGRLLMQMPNVRYVEAHLPARTWIEERETIELVEQSWSESSRRLEGTRRTLVGCEQVEECPGHVPFQRRLYEVEELAEVFDEVGLRLGDVFDEHGRPCAPDDSQQELLVEARV